MRFFLIILVFFSLAHSAWSAERKCLELSKQLALEYSKDMKCECGQVLKNLEVSLPAGVKLVAACDVGRIDGNPVDFLKNKISLDKYLSSGRYYTGRFYFSGKLNLVGEIEVAESQATDMRFSVASDLGLNSGSVFSHYFKYFEIGSDENFRKLKAPRPTDLQPCLQAKAKMIVKNFRVNISDTDGDGLFPDEIQVLSVTPFKKCSVPRE